MCIFTSLPPLHFQLSRLYCVFTSSGLSLLSKKVVRRGRSDKVFLSGARLFANQHHTNIQFVICLKSTPNSSKLNSPYTCSYFACVTLPLLFVLLNSLWIRVDWCTFYHTEITDCSFVRQQSHYTCHFFFSKMKIPLLFVLLMHKIFIVVELHIKICTLLILILQKLNFCFLLTTNYNTKKCSQCLC